RRDARSHVFALAGSAARRGLSRRRPGRGQDAPHPAHPRARGTHPRRHAHLPRDRAPDLVAVGTRGGQAMNPGGAARDLRERAKGLGFDAVGIAQARRLDRDGEALAAWLAGDRNASMAWMARRPEQRSDPELLLPGCRSVVVVALNYWSGSNGKTG